MALALARALASIRSGVLNQIRIPVSSCQEAAGDLSSLLSRGFAEGTYLSKDEVAERVVNVVKHFDKIDAGKVGHIDITRTHHASG